MKYVEGARIAGWSQVGPRRAPFEPSRVVRGLGRTGRFASYTEADTWYPSWGSDGRLYSPFTDGTVGGIRSVSAPGDDAVTGWAAIEGDSPLDLRFVDVGVVGGSALPYEGRYPSASLVHDGVWYYGTYCLADGGRGLNFDVLGPFVGFRTSVDGGATWVEGPHSPSSSIFGESALEGEPVRMGAPHFVDFGKNLENSPDGYAYMVGHGSRVNNGTLSWISGDEITLGRVWPSVDTINDPAAWEWAAGRGPDGEPRWVSSLEEAVPIASWPGHMGCVTVTFVPGLGRYLMCVTDGWPTIGMMDSYVLESESLLGPWRMAAYMDTFGQQGYFLNIPSKFISSDGDKMWLCYSANFTNGDHTRLTTFQPEPEGSRYAMCLQELQVVHGVIRGDS